MVKIRFMMDNTINSMPNIALFECVTCKVFTLLQHAFPNPCDISSTQLAQQLMLENHLEHIMPLELAIEISAVIAWWQKADFIWVGGHELNDFFDVTLSKHGLAKLLSENDGVTLGQHLTETGSTKTRAKLLKALISD